MIEVTDRARRAIAPHIDWEYILANMPSDQLGHNEELASVAALAEWAMWEVEECDLDKDQARAVEEELYEPMGWIMENPPDPLCDLCHGEGCADCTDEEEVYNGRLETFQSAVYEIVHEWVWNHPLEVSENDH